MYLFKFWKLIHNLISKLKPCIVSVSSSEIHDAWCTKIKFNKKQCKDNLVVSESNQTHTSDAVYQTCRIQFRFKRSKR